MTERPGTITSTRALGVVSRRRFLAAAGGFAALGLTGCSTGRFAGSGSEPVTTSATPATPATPATGPTGTVTATTIPAGNGIAAVPGDRVLVVVNLDGGNDAINTLVPESGRYHDLRPNLALDPATLITHSSLGGHGLHPALAPLQRHLDAGTLGVVAGVGFADPDRSHFVSTDRWDRADRMDEQLGWAGRWLDTLDVELPPLGATAIGSDGRVLVGAERSGTAVGSVDAFAFPASVDHADIRRLAGGGGTAATMTEPSDALAAAARSAFLTSVGAVEDFDDIADAVRSSDGSASPRPSGPFGNGLALAAELIRTNLDTRIVTVNVNGFDTHSAQLAQHAALLDDLATGLDSFWSTLEASGDHERVMVITTSEFGRRAQENSSAGSDHGSAGLSLVMGHTVSGGLHGSIDVGRLVDGDLAPMIDPRGIFTAALDWVGGDVERILGGRWDDVALLRT